MPAATGTAQSRQQLYLDHHGWLHGWLRRRLGDREHAADIAHDTFLRLLVTATPWQLGQTVKAKQEQYTVVDLMARYRFTEQVSATLNVNNLFDKKYLSALDTTFYGGYYGDPRNVMLTTQYRF